LRLRFDCGVIFDFRFAEAKHALIPLVQVDAIEESSTVQEALECFERHRHSRMPIFSGRVDNIIGILEIADLLAASDIKQPIRHYITPAHYVAETHILQDLMLEMTREDNEMVIVVDEHGGAVGILTFEDIVEELIGEFTTSFSNLSNDPHWLADGTYLASGTASLRDLNRLLKLDLPLDGPRTLNGLILEKLEAIPDYDVSIRIADVVMEIVQFDEHGVKTVKLYKPITQSNLD
jgi:CBS domain containing-hemolysin-like protein